MVRTFGKQRGVAAVAIAAIASIGMQPLVAAGREGPERRAGRVQADVVDAGY